MHFWSAPERIWMWKTVTVSSGRQFIHKLFTLTFVIFDNTQQNRTSPKMTESLICLLHQIVIGVNQVEPTFSSMFKFIHKTKVQDTSRLQILRSAQLYIWIAGHFDLKATWEDRFPIVKGVFWKDAFGGILRSIASSNATKHEDRHLVKRRQ